MPKLIPGRNTGTREAPCPECKSTTSRHFTFCRHYLYQQQYRAAVARSLEDDANSASLEELEAAEAIFDKEG